MNRKIRLTVQTTVVEERTIDVDLDEVPEDLRDAIMDTFEESWGGDAEIEHEVKDEDFDYLLAQREGEIGEDGAFAVVSGRLVTWVTIVDPTPESVLGVATIIEDDDRLAAAGDAWRDEQEMS